MFAISLAVFAMAVSKIFVLEALPAVMGSLIPMCSPAFESLPISMAISAMMFFFWGKRQGISFFVGWLVSISILSVSNPVSLFFPGIEYSFSLLSDDLGLSIFFLFAGIILYSNHEKASDWLASFPPENIRKTVFLFFFVFLFLLSLSPVLPINVCQALESKNNTKVIVNGRICSDITGRYGYSVFDLCYKNCTIAVWSGIPIDFAYGQNITVSGTYTTKYGEPEVYRISWVD